MFPVLLIPDILVSVDIAKNLYFWMTITGAKTCY